MRIKSYESTQQPTHRQPKTQMPLRQHRQQRPLPWPHSQLHQHLRPPINLHQTSQPRLRFLPPLLLKHHQHGNTTHPQKLTILQNSQQSSTIPQHGLPRRPLRLGIRLRPRKRYRRLMQKIRTHRIRSSTPARSHLWLRRPLCRKSLLQVPIHNPCQKSKSRSLRSSLQQKNSSCQFLPLIEICIKVIPR